VGGFLADRNLPCLGARSLKVIYLSTQVNYEIGNLGFEERESGHDLGISFGLISGGILGA